MRIVDVIQGSEQWEKLRCGIPTASNFGKIVTPAKCQLSASASSYAVELIAAERGLVVPPLPSYWMEWGTEHEPYAVAAYEQLTGVKTTTVGFAWPDDHQKYGCSPDRLVGEDGLLQVKCPKPETLLEYHLKGGLPAEYKPQVQGELLVTGRDWNDFFAYHPELPPYRFRAERDDKYIVSLAVALEEFDELLISIRQKLQDIGEPIDVQLTDDYQPVNYEPSEMQL